MATKNVTKIKMKDADIAIQNSINKVVDNFKKARPNGKIGAKNQAFATNFSDTTSIWPAAGTLTVEGLVYYSISADLVATNGTNWGSIDFTASGFGLVAAGFAVLVTGAFLVDPSTLPANCNWNVADLGGTSAFVSLTVFSESGTFYGRFIGAGPGIGVADWGGSNGVLTYS